jgi:hypothetical protein
VPQVRWREGVHSWISLEAIQQANNNRFWIASKTSTLETPQLLNHAAVTIWLLKKQMSVQNAAGLDVLFKLFYFMIGRKFYSHAFS